MTVCDIRSDSFSITTTTMALCEDSVFVSTKHQSQSTEKKLNFKEGGQKRSDFNQEGYGIKENVFWQAEI